MYLNFQRKFWSHMWYWDIDIFQCKTVFVCLFDLWCAGHHPLLINPNSVGCWVNIKGIVEDGLTFHLHLPPGLKLIKSNSTPLKNPAQPRPLDTVQLKDIVCYLSLLEGGRPEDKLECKCHTISWFLWRFGTLNIWGTVRCRIWISPCSRFMNCRDTRSIVNRDYTTKNINDATEPIKSFQFFRLCKVRVILSEKGRVQEDKGNVMTVCSAALLKNAGSNLN